MSIALDADNLLSYLYKKHEKGTLHQVNLKYLAQTLGWDEVRMQNALGYLEGKNAIKTTKVLTGIVLVDKVTARGIDLAESILEHNWFDNPTRSKLLALAETSGRALATSNQASDPTNILHNEDFEWDVFICHATEDKELFVEELAAQLKNNDVKVWYDDFVLRIGDSVGQKIDNGLLKSHYGVVVLSPNFFKKAWPRKELEGLMNKERSGEKVILPVWLNLDYDAVFRQSPMLAGRVAAEAKDGMPKVVSELLRVIKRTGGDNSKPRKQANKGSGIFDFGKFEYDLGKGMGLWDDENKKSRKSIFDH